MIVASVAKAQAESLLIWAQQWEADGRSGASEVAFLLKRAAHGVGMIADDKTPVFDPLPHAADPAVEEPREG